MEEDGASLNPLFSSSAGSESSSAPLTLPDGFNWSPLARNRAQESLPTKRLFVTLKEGLKERN